MHFKHTEIKDSVWDDYNELRKGENEPLYNIYYAFFEDISNSIHKTHNLTEKISIYVSFVSILILQKENYDFLEKELDEVIKSINKKEIKDEIGEEEFRKFEKDLNIILNHKRRQIT